MILLKILPALAVLTVAVVALQMPQYKDWPQEPGGFNGLNFLATKAEIEKIIKLGSCKPMAPINPMPLETNECKVALALDGTNLDGSVQFTSGKGGRDGDGKLTQILGKIGVANYETVKTAVLKMYGEPHLIQNVSDGVVATFWSGKRANIILSFSKAGGTLVISPSQFVIGGVSISNYLGAATLERRPTKVKSVA